ncbi:hypothetical protein GH733_000707 [Mirounga leonina]|nr:hypothetical protein GH733_000707 [Mirounga leonina]
MEIQKSNSRPPDKQVCKFCESKDLHSTWLGVQPSQKWCCSGVIVRHSDVLKEPSASLFPSTSISSSVMSPPSRCCSRFRIHMISTSKVDKSLLETEPLQGRDEDTVASADFSSMLSEEEREELKAELVQNYACFAYVIIYVREASQQYSDLSTIGLEDEITTLRQVLSAKERHLVEIKQKLGMNLMNELKQNFSRSWYDVQTTTAYKKTHETLSHAGQKATAAFSNVGTAISKKFGDMRNSPTFKSFEERVETTVTSLKTKVGGANHGGGSFEEVLSSTAHASAQSSGGGPRRAEDEELQC